MIAIAAFADPKLAATTVWRGIRKTCNAIAWVAGWTWKLVFSAVLLGGIASAPFIEGAAVGPELRLLGALFCGYLLYATWSPTGRAQHRAAIADTTLRAELASRIPRWKQHGESLRRLPWPVRLFCIASSVTAITLFAAFTIALLAPVVAMLSSILRSILMLVS